MTLFRRLDRYVLWQFLKVLVLAQISLTIITVLVHLMDHINIYLDQNASYGDVARYYALQVPYDQLLTLPMAMLIATVLTIGELGRHGELTAMKASGISLYRTAAPLFAFGMAVALLVLAVGETVIPQVNQRSNVIYDQDILGREVEYENYRGSFVYQNSAGYTYLVRSLFVEDSISSADEVEIQRRYRDGTFLRINASQMTWEPSTRTWVLQDGEVRVFPGLRVGAMEAADGGPAGTGGTTGATGAAGGGGATGTAGPGGDGSGSLGAAETGDDRAGSLGAAETGGGPRPGPSANAAMPPAPAVADSAAPDDRAVNERMYAFRILRSPHLDDSPQELLAREKDPEELGYAELESYIAERERLGADTRKERVDLHMKLAYPFANFIIVLFGVALVGSSSHAGRQSATAGFGFALFLTIVFWGFIRVGQGIGYGGGLEPPVAAWLANAVFGAVGIALLFRART